MKRRLLLASFNPDIPDRSEHRQLTYDSALYQRFERDARIQRDTNEITVERWRIRVHMKRTIFSIALLAGLIVLGLLKGALPLPSGAWTFSVWRQWTLEPPWQTWITGFLMGMAVTYAALSAWKILVHAVRLYLAKEDLAEAQKNSAAR